MSEQNYQAKLTDIARHLERIAVALEKLAEKPAPVAIHQHHHYAPAAPPPPAVLPYRVYYN